MSSNGRDPSRTRKLIVLFVAIPVVFVLATGGLLYWNGRSLNDWIHEDTGNLQPYPSILVDQSKTVSSDNKRDGDLAKALSDGRLVVKMTRSEYRKKTLSLNNEQWVKIHLVTSKPGEPSTQIQIKLLVLIYKDDSGDWRIKSQRELALP